jgi:hypothetical protein
LAGKLWRGADCKDGITGFVFRSAWCTDMDPRNTNRAFDRIRITAGLDAHTFQRSDSKQRFGGARREKPARLRPNEYREAELREPQATGGQEPRPAACDRARPELPNGCHTTRA